MYSLLELKVIKWSNFSDQTCKHVLNIIKNNHKYCKKKTQLIGFIRHKRGLWILGAPDLYLIHLACFVEHPPTAAGERRLSIVWPLLLSSCHNIIITIKGSARSRGCKYLYMYTRLYTHRRRSYERIRKTLEFSTGRKTKNSSYHCAFFCYVLKLNLTINLRCDL
jgi:hypothetical protein